MMELYGKFEEQSPNRFPGRRLPSCDVITEDWANFRWLQISFIAEISYVSKYGDDGKFRTNYKKMENEVLDHDYLFFASLFGALASNDNEMIARFKRLRPDGEVFSCN